MALYDNEPDPYTYERNGSGAYGKARYRVLRDGEPLGFIDAGTRSTDTPIAGTRLRRPGKGAPAFYVVGDQYRIPHDRRRDAAADLESSLRSGETPVSDG
jgi:hypothetical protein